MWDGSSDYSDGLSNYLNPTRKSTAPHREFSCDGIETSQLCCDLSAIPQVESLPTESLQCMEIAATSSHLIIYQNCIQNWLGNSTEPLSDWDTLIIRLIQIRTALQYSVLGTMAAVALLASGMSISKGFAKITHKEFAHQSLLLETWRYDASR